MERKETIDLVVHRNINHLAICSPSVYRHHSLNPPLEQLLGFLSVPSELVRNGQVVPLQVKELNLSVKRKTTQLENTWDDKSIDHFIQPLIRERLAFSNEEKYVVSNCYSLLVKTCSVRPVLCQAGHSDDSTTTFKAGLIQPPRKPRPSAQTKTSLPPLIILSLSNSTWDS